MKVCPNLPDTIHFHTTPNDTQTEVMRITREGVWVNPDMQINETAKAVLDALDSQVKVMVQRAVEEERETIIKWLIDEGFFVKDGPLTEAIRARGEK